MLAVLTATFCKVSQLQNNFNNLKEEMYHLPQTYMFISDVLFLILTLLSVSAPTESPLRPSLCESAFQHKAFLVFKVTNLQGSANS